MELSLPLQAQISTSGFIAPFVPDVAYPVVRREKLIRATKNSFCCPECCFMGFRYPQPDNEDGYEDFCLRFYRLHLDRGGLKKYGKRGQRQYGIDLIDEFAIKPLLAVQCKHRESTKELKAKEIEHDVAEAEKAPHEFKHFIIATTAQKSTRTQDTVVRLNQRPERRFTVDLYFWEDICRHVSELPRALQDYVVYGERVAEGSSALQDVVSRLGSPATSADAPSGDTELFPSIIQLFDQRQIEVAEYEIGKLPNPEIDTSLSPNKRYGILRLRGKLALEKLNYDEACRLFFLAYETQPDLDQAKYNRILALEFSGRHDRAFEEASKLVDAGNESPTLLSLFIRNASALDEIEQRKAIIWEVATKHEDVNLALAHALLAFGKFVEAAEAANRAVALAPDSAHAHMAAGMTTHNSGFKGDWRRRKENLESAVEHYSSALQLARRDKYFGLLPEALINRARIHAFLDRDQEAAHDYKEAVEVSGKPALYGPDAVSFFLSTGDYNSAAELAALLDSNNVESQFLQNVAKYGVATDDAQKRKSIVATAAFADAESEHSIEARFLSVQWALDLSDFALAESCVSESFVIAHPFQANTLLAWTELEKGSVNQHEPMLIKHMKRAPRRLTGRRLQFWLGFSHDLVMMKKLCHYGSKQSQLACWISIAKHCLIVRNGFRGMIRYCGYALSYATVVRRMMSSVGSKYVY